MALHCLSPEAADYGGSIDYSVRLRMRLPLRMFALLAAFTPAIIPVNADAAWFKAENSRFVMFGDSGEESLRKQISDLSAFDSVLRTRHQIANDRSTTQKLSIYIVGNPDQLRRVYPSASAGIQGYYLATPNIIYLAAGRMEGDSGSRQLVFHEYVHHFMFHYFPAATPEWISEGYAEYFMTAEVGEDTVVLGKYNKSRAATLLSSDWLPLESLLTGTARSYAPAKANLFYAQAWLLTHYMLSDEGRARQFGEVATRISKGRPSSEALREVTGLSSAQITSALRTYLRSGLVTRTIPAPSQGGSDARIIPLPASADELLLEQLALNTSMRASRAPEFVRSVRAASARYPGDRMADLTHAQLEVTLGDRLVGEAILENYLRADPNDAETLRLMAKSRLIAGIREPRLAPQYRTEARAFLGRAYQADPNDYRTLFAYAMARAADSDYPTENTLEVLLRAHRLAPSVGELSLQTGAALLARGRTAEARIVLERLANSPHASSLRTRAVQLLTDSLPST